MPSTEPSQFSDWESFYVIVGSASAALTGLMFVAMTLIAAARVRANSRTLSAFGTPTVVHFSTVIVLSAGLAAPWHSMGRPSLFVGSIGGAGLVYGCVVLRHAHIQSDYQAVVADWLWHNLLPMGAYATLVVSAVLLRGHPRPSAFAIAAASLLLLIVGIHNAWDNVTFITTHQSDGQDA